MCYGVSTYKTVRGVARGVLVLRRSWREVVSINIFRLSSWLLIVGLASACGSGNDADPTVSIGDTAGADSPSIDGSESADGTDGESNPVVETETGGDSDAQGVDQTAGEESAEAEVAIPQDDDQQTTSEGTEAPENTESENTVDTTLVSDNRPLQFGAAKLLVDLEPNGDSFPAKFHRTNDTLYFWTIDTDPRFGRCAPHWGTLGDDDKNIAFSLVATNPYTGVVSMNKQIMTLGDFGEDPNQACRGYNGSIMDAFEQHWNAEKTPTGEQQFQLNFDRFVLGPDQVWVTGGDDSSTRLMETGALQERAFIEGDKVFFITESGLSVADSLSGERRKLFEADGGDNEWDIKRIERSPPQEATFEIRVGENRQQVWTYNLDTDDWVKKISIKPDSNTYWHRETLEVSGDTLLSVGRVGGIYSAVLGVSRHSGDVTSFEILTDQVDSFTNSVENAERLVFTTTDFGSEPTVTSIWSYHDGQIEKHFAMPESNLQNTKIIAGQDGHIYLTGTISQGEWPEYKGTLELWSYDLQTEQLVKLSNDSWYGYRNVPSPDEGYLFRHLATTDGLIFINLTADSGRELWFTDGTPGGTRQLTDINPGAGNSDPQNFYYARDAIYFSANDGTHGDEPWMIPVSR